jgi:lysophospholipase L1-like esterase
VNRARGGRNARRFIDAADEQSLELVWDAAEPGDYLFVQFGTNDSNSGGATYVNVDGDSIPYYLEPQTDFKTWLRVYIDGARERRVTPVLVTPPPRRSCTDDSHSFGNGTARWATAMKELAVETGTVLIDLNQKTLDHLNMIGCIASADFFFSNGGSVDGTHFSKTGAALMAAFVASGITEAALPLASRLK